MAAFSTLALAGLTLAGGASKYFSEKKQGASAQAQGDYEAAMLGQNADLADAQATDAIARGALSEQKLRGQTRQVVGAQRTALAAQGIDINSGSAGAVQGETNSIGEFDALTTRLNAQREAYGYTTQATDYRNRAALARQGGANAAGAANTAAFGTLLTTGSSLYGQYRTAKG
jgi:hypothetical protein